MDIPPFGSIILDPSITEELTPQDSPEIEMIFTDESLVTFSDGSQVVAQE